MNQLATLADPERWSMPAIVVIFLLVASVIAWFGVKMTDLARDLAYETGLGEALMGSLFIGASTSLSGITTSTPAQTAADDGQPPEPASLLWMNFALVALVVGTAGWVLAQLAVPLADKSGPSQTVVGGIFTAVSTSVPELAVAVSAVRLGALSLAVGDIIGGNAFDTLFVAASDFAHRAGSIHAAITNTERLWLAISLLMTGVLLMGLIIRERRGPGNIGLESVMLLVVYVGGVLFLGLV